MCERVTVSFELADALWREALFSSRTEIIELRSSEFARDAHELPCSDEMRALSVLKRVQSQAQPNSATRIRSYADRVIYANTL
jgi:hypothetical protein